MKSPAKIYTHFQDSHYNGHIGFWSIDMATEGKVEYIRRDVVIGWATEIVDLALSGYFLKEDTLNELLNCKIEDATTKGVKK